MTVIIINRINALNNEIKLGQVIFLNGFLWYKENNMQFVTPYVNNAKPI